MAVTTATVLVNYFSYLTRTRNDYGLFFFNRLFEGESRFLGLVMWATRTGVGAHGDQRLVWLTTCLALTSWFSVILNTIYYRRQGLLQFFGAMLPWSEVRALLKYSGRSASVLRRLGALFLDIYLLRKLSTKAETADYVFAVGIVELVSIVSQSALLDWPRFFFKVMRDGATDRDQIVSKRAAYFLWLHVATIEIAWWPRPANTSSSSHRVHARPRLPSATCCSAIFFFLAGNLFSAGLGYAKRTHPHPDGVHHPRRDELRGEPLAHSALRRDRSSHHHRRRLPAVRRADAGRRARASYRFTGGLRFAAVTAAAVFVALVRLPH